MAEITDLLPMPPQLGPPLPGSFKVLWPWVKQPPPPPVLAVAALKRQNESLKQLVADLSLKVHILKKSEIPGLE